MSNLANRLKSILELFCTSQRATSDDFEVTVGTTPIGRLYAILVWNRFDSMEVTQRQEKVWEFVRSHLPNKADQQNISAVFTHGAAEFAVTEELKAQEREKLPWM